MSIIIKPMESRAEIEGKAYVHYKSWQETYAGLVDEGYLANMTYERCLAIAEKFPDRLLVAMDGERVVGFVGYGAYRDGSMPGCGEVYAIYLLAEYQGRKIGYELMKAACEKLADYPKIALWVLKGNRRAIDFYTRYGFAADGCEVDVKLGSMNKEIRMIYTR
ncbi:MAG: GNAT family N-acetyltransferase [Clostridia bacterium]|nr:GNAT family N-acetyltransferase [Clostridia bacterium]